MLEKITYINHMNERIDFGSNGIFIGENELHDFTWTITEKNSRISSFSKGIVTKAIPVVIYCKTREESIAARNRLFEVCEKDVLALKHGRIVIGDYYLKCFVTESKKTTYLKAKTSINIALVISTDQPYWIKESTYTYNISSSSSEGSGLDYNNDFPYDYTTNMIGTLLFNEDFVPSNFRINIYGACVNPSISINGHIYSVNVEIAAKECLTIDSIEKTIVLTHADGTQTNCFNKRDKTSYIFEKIPSGYNPVASSGDFIYSITLLEERGEPKWI